MAGGDTRAHRSHRRRESLQPIPPRSARRSGRRGTRPPLRAWDNRQLQGGSVCGSRDDEAPDGGRPIRVVPAQRRQPDARRPASPAPPAASRSPPSWDSSLSPLSRSRSSRVFRCSSGGSTRSRPFSLQVHTPRKRERGRPSLRPGVHREGGGPDRRVDPLHRRGGDTRHLPRSNAKSTRYGAWEQDDRLRKGSPSTCSASRSAPCSSARAFRSPPGSSRRLWRRWRRGPRCRGSS